MSDDFDAFLADQLAPPERRPDRRFIAAVQARIAMEERFRQQRRALWANLASQLAALGAVATGIWWLSRAAPVANWTGQFPATTLAMLVAGFALAVGLFSRQPPNADVSAGL
jgi:hypothetical protein